MANNLSAFKAEAWSRSLIMNLDKVNVMLPLVNRDYEGDVTGIGSTVQVRTPGSITMGAYTKGQPISYQDLTPAREQLVVNTSEYFAFNVDDIDAAQNDLNALNVYTMRAAVAMNDRIEAELLSNYSLVAAANRITGATDAAIGLTTGNVYEHFVKARTALSKQSVPMAGRWAVIDPDTTALLLRSSEFIRATDLGDRVVQSGLGAGAAEAPGFVGQVAGFDVYESNNVPVAAGAKYLIFGDRFFISYAAQIREMEALRLQTTFATAVRGLLLHDSAVFAECAKRGATIKATA